MTEEPYRWLEAVANRREYVRDQLKGGSPVLAASLPDGILLLGVGGGQSKVFEFFDRQALAGLGHPADIEKIRQAAIDAAHVEAFTRAPEDVSLRRLVSFGLGPQLKTNFEQIFSAPFLVELLLAELAPEPAHDLFFGCILTALIKCNPAASSWPPANRKRRQPGRNGSRNPSKNKPDRAEVADILLQAWWLQSENKSLTDPCPTKPRARPAGAKPSKAKSSKSAGWPGKARARRATKL